MKRVANSYSARTISAVSYGPNVAERYLWWIPRFPNYVWLAMIILAVSALSVSTFMSSQEQEREAKAAYSYTKSRVENAKGVSQQIKERTEQIRRDPNVAAQTVQNQLRLVRRNEIVVAVP